MFLKHLGHYLSIPIYNINIYNICLRHRAIFKSLCFRREIDDNDESDRISRQESKDEEGTSKKQPTDDRACCCLGASGAATIAHLNLETLFTEYTRMARVAFTFNI